MYSMYLVCTVDIDQTVLLNISSTTSHLAHKLIHNYTSIVMEQGLITLIYIDKHIRYGDLYPSVKENTLYLV